MIERAASHKSDHPERAEELDGIIADASIWLQSKDQERAANALGELEMRLASISAR